VPYAAPPVGKLRWKPPAPVAPWRPAVRDATKPPSPCLQFAGYGIPSQTPLGREDCLYLNVYRPAGGRTGQRLPVLVVIPGGAFTTGSTDLFDPSAFAATTDTVVVTINYRLNVFGFLALPSLTAEAPDHSSGNDGLLDQQAALRWVQRNIGAFGGDPGNVTIDGQSSGAISVCAQLASPTAKGLFARAIIESGSCLANTLPEAEAAGTKFADALGCTNAATAAACLRAKPATALLAKSAAGTVPTPAPYPTGPNVSGRVLPVLPRQAIAAGSWNKVPVMIGSNHDEWRPLAPYLVGFPSKPQTFRGVITKEFGPAAPRVLAAYPLGQYTDPAYAMGAVLTDMGAEYGIGSCETGQLAGLFAASAPTYAYEFADSNAPPLTTFVTPPGFDPGAEHGSELAYLFHYALVKQPLTVAQQRLSAQMMRYWATFARTGAPNAANLVPWPRDTHAGDQVLELRPTGNTVSAAFAVDHHCSLWNALTAAP